MSMITRSAAAAAAAAAANVPPGKAEEGGDVVMSNPPIDRKVETADPQPPRVPESIIIDLGVLQRAEKVKPTEHPQYPIFYDLRPYNITTGELQRILKLFPEDQQPTLLVALRLQTNTRMQAQSFIPFAYENSNILVSIGRPGLDHLTKSSGETQAIGSLHRRLYPMHPDAITRENVHNFASRILYLHFQEFSIGPYDTDEVKQFRAILERLRTSLIKLSFNRLQSASLHLEGFTQLTSASCRVEDTFWYGSASFTYSDCPYMGIR